MVVSCPFCERDAYPEESPVCPGCGCEVSILATIVRASHDSLLLSLEALREGRAADAHDFACEAWALRRSRETAAAGLLAAVMLESPVEIARWIRRRRGRA